jgi:hypothetical protein
MRWSPSLRTLQVPRAVSPITGLRNGTGLDLGLRSRWSLQPRLSRSWSLRHEGAAGVNTLPCGPPLFYGEAKGVGLSLTLGIPLLTSGATEGLQPWRPHWFRERIPRVVLVRWGAVGCGDEPSPIRFCWAAFRPCHYPHLGPQKRRRNEWLIIRLSYRLVHSDFNTSHRPSPRPSPAGRGRIVLRSPCRSAFIDILEVVSRAEPKPNCG